MIKIINESIQSEIQNNYNEIVTKINEMNETIANKLFKSIEVNSKNLVKYTLQDMLGFYLKATRDGTVELIDIDTLDDEEKEELIKTFKTEITDEYIKLSLKTQYEELFDNILTSID